MPDFTFWSHTIYSLHFNPVIKIKTLQFCLLEVVYWHLEYFLKISDYCIEFLKAF
jgi:hypothetical protein